MVVGAGCSPSFTPPASPCLVSGSRPLRAGKPPASCCIASTRSTTHTSPCFTCWRRPCSRLATLGPTRRLLRQQLKWLYRGAWLAVGPFTVFYAIPFILDIRMSTILTKLAGLSLVFLPLTFCWAIIRYRLMDTDLIFKRGVAYTLATATLARRLLRLIALSSVTRPSAAARSHSRMGLNRRYHRHGRDLRSPEASHSGLGRQGIRPAEIRLPQGSDRVRPQPKFRDEP